MKHLTLEQRYALKAYLQCGLSKTEIAKRLGVHKSTIYQELQRNKRKKGAYNPDFAQELSEERNRLRKSKNIFSTSLKNNIALNS